jgi:hypothetical protein
MHNNAIMVQSRGGGGVMCGRVCDFGTVREEKKSVALVGGIARILK